MNKNLLAACLLSAVVAGCSSQSQTEKTAQPTTPKPKNVEVVIDGVAGFQDTPLEPDGKWHVHDPARPQPVVVTPGSTFSQQAAPPSDAIVLFDGTDLSHWRDKKGAEAPWRIDEGVMISAKSDIETTNVFGDIQLHLEFKEPSPAKGEGQGRGNSGVYFMGLYEIQVLDCYQSKSYADGSTGGLYGQHPALANACRPPGEWQTYDCIFTAPRFGANGEVLSPAYLTATLNGVVVQNHQAFRGATNWKSLGQYKAHAAELPLALQYHSNPVSFRNIWVRAVPFVDSPEKFEPTLKMKKLAVLLAVAWLALTLQAAPKKLLVVTTTTGFRHSSISTLEKMLAELGKDSGEFTVDFVQQPEGKPEPLKKDAADADKAVQAMKEDKWNSKLQSVLLEKLSPESLKHYDGVVFASTTGDLPIPDKQGFLDWIKAGHAFIGLHAATDTFHQWPGFIDMIGGEFKRHGPQVSVDCVNQDPANPAAAGLPKIWTLRQEEIYQFTNYDSAKVHDLLVLEKHPETGAPGHYPVSWCKDYGAGKVFYTSIGHREDIIDADPDLKNRVNSVAISRAYRAHVLGGIEWALGLKK